MDSLREWMTLAAQDEDACSLLLQVAHTEGRCLKSVTGFDTPAIDYLLGRLDTAGANKGLRKALSHTGKQGSRTKRIVYARSVALVFYLYRESGLSYDEAIDATVDATHTSASSVARHAETYKEHAAEQMRWIQEQANKQSVELKPFPLYPPNPTDNLPAGTGVLHDCFETAGGGNAAVTS